MHLTCTGIFLYWNYILLSAWLKLFATTGSMILNSLILFHDFKHSNASNRSTPMRFRRSLRITAQRQQLWLVLTAYWVPSCLNRGICAVELGPATKLVRHGELKEAVIFVASCRVTSKNNKSLPFYSADFNNNEIKIKKKSLYYVNKSLPFKWCNYEVKSWGFKSLSSNGRRWLEVHMYFYINFSNSHLKNNKYYNTTKH